METIFTRICPVCKTEVTHKNKNSRNIADKLQKPCRRCSAISVSNRPQIKDSFKRRLANTEVCSGENNKFFGKKHSIETREHLKQIDRPHLKTEAFRQTCLNALNAPVGKSGQDNPMFGKTVYDVWLSKYGKAEADRRDAIRKSKWSKASSGSNNPMYGKPSPTGSGNGWSGWYKGWYFRSLKELSYVVNVLEPGQHKWRSGEGAIRINYVDSNGNARTYSPDFFVDDHRIVEIKPAKLKSSRIVRTKEAAAKLYCEHHGFAYQLIDPAALTNSSIRDLHQAGLIKFIDRYEAIFVERYLSLP